MRTEPPVSDTLCFVIIELLKSAMCLKTYNKIMWFK